jgi:hypothetical protein
METCAECSSTLQDKFTVNKLGISIGGLPEERRDFFFSYETVKLCFLRTYDSSVVMATFRQRKLVVNVQ